MGASDGEAEYRVYEFGPDDIDQHPFTGSLAFTRANERFERLKADPGIWQLWLARFDGRAWHIVAAEARHDPDGEWERVGLLTLQSAPARG